MARFYGTIRGKAQTTATRIGTVNSGMYAHIRGWNFGAAIRLDTTENDEDHIAIFLTSGSKNENSSKCIWSGTRADYDALIGEREVKA